MSDQLSGKELRSAVVTAVMSSNQGDRDDACKKLQGHIIAVESRLAEAEKLLKQATNTCSPWTKDCIDNFMRAATQSGTAQTTEGSRP